MLLRYFIVVGITAEAIGLPKAEDGLFEDVAFGRGDGKDYLCDLSRSTDDASELTLSILVPIGDITGIEKRQTAVPTQHNISQVITPLITGRWTASIDAQLQLSSMPGTSDPKCTMSICTGPGVCGAKKDIGNSWSTFSLKVQLRVNEPQTIAFVTTCSTPASVALRNIVITGSGAAATITALRTMTAAPTPAAGTIILPATTMVSTFASIETQVASLGSASSIVIRNECPNSWASMYGDQDFLHIPPGGLAIVPAKPMDRFVANVQHGKIV